MPTTPSPGALLNDLSDHGEREKGITQLLNDSKVGQQFETLRNKDGVFALQLKDEYASVFQDERLKVRLDREVIRPLVTLGLATSMKSIRMGEMLESIITKADPSMNPNTRAALAVLKLGGYQTDLDMTSGLFKINLLTPHIANLFSQLDRTLVTTQDNFVCLHINPYLKQCTDSLILIDQGIDKKPILLLNSYSIRQDQILMVESACEEGHIDLKPYVFVPKPAKTPTYYFILDTSSSMRGERLKNLQASVLKFAQAIFAFDQKASLKIGEFDREFYEVGTFSSQDINSLSYELSALRAEGGTKIADTCVAVIKELRDHLTPCHVLLFTDGQDEHGLESVTSLQQQLTELTEAQKTRNKFFVISFAQQPEHLQHLVDMFSSKLIIHSTPDLQEALNTQGQLQSWAAARDIFVIRTLVISAEKGAQKEEYQERVNQSGQLMPLRAMRVRPGDKVSISIRDSQGSVSIVSEREIPVPSPENIEFSPAPTLAARDIAVDHHQLSSSSSAVSSRSSTQSMTSSDQGTPGRSRAPFRFLESLPRDRAITNEVAPVDESQTEQSSWSFRCVMQ